MRNKNLGGTGVAIVTPFTEYGVVDTIGLRNLVQHLHSGKVDYMVIMGTTGESVTLDEDEKQLVIDTVNKYNGNKIPMVLGIGGNNTADVIKTFKRFNLRNFEAILSVAPYYNKPTQEGYYQHYKAIAENSKKDIILYNVPGRTGSNVSWETQVRIAKDFRNIAATKEASGNMEQIMKIIMNKPRDFMVLSGDDNLTLPIIAAGGHGVISVVANAFPKEYSLMVRHCLNGDFEKARKLHYKLINFTDQLFADGNPGGIKHALHIMKVCSPFLRLPLTEPNQKVKDKISALIKEIQP